LTISSLYIREELKFLIEQKKQKKIMKTKSALNFYQKSPFGQVVSGSKTPKNTKPDLNIKTFSSKKKLAFHSASNSSGAQKTETPKSLQLTKQRSKGVSSPNISLNSSSSSNQTNEKTTAKDNANFKKKNTVSKTGFFK
jgi:hypothetical protein